MAKTKYYTHEPDYAVPPGGTLLETINAQGMDQKELAARTGLDKKTINQIIKGIHPLSQQTAIKLERVTGVPARIWNNLEMQYQERSARIKDRQRLEANLEWLKMIPVRELIARGVIKKQPDKLSQLQAVLSFFGFSSTTEWKGYWQETFACRFRRAQKVPLKQGVTETWIRLGEIQARNIQCKPYDKKKFLKVLKNMRALTSEVPSVWQEKMVSQCAEAGVAVVFVPEIRGCPVSGLTQWLTSEKALIHLSLRYKSDDQFWFTFFHEADHILKDPKKAVYIKEDGGNNESDRRADRFAANFLIPTEYRIELQRLRSTNDVERFARKLGVAPGIVVGQMQKRGIAPYSHFNKLKRKLVWAKAK